MIEAASSVDITDSIQVSTSIAMASTSSNDAVDGPVNVTTTTVVDADTDAFASTSYDIDDKSKVCASNADATGDLTRDNCTHTSNQTKKNKHPQVTPCSLDPSYWPKRRVRVTTIGCLTSAIVCIVRLLANHDSIAYIIHSFIVFFDLILIHIFTYTPWLSIAGELTAIAFAVTYYLTNERIFELLETTLIAVFVSIHMIESRDEHWDREEGLEREVIGLQLHIEQFLVQHDVNRDGQLRRYSSVSIVDEHDDDTRDVEIGVETRNANLDTMSSITTYYAPGVKKADLQMQQQLRQQDVEPGKMSRRCCCKVAFAHFLDGAAGVLYTSFFGLILDEIINFGTDKYQK